MNLRNVGRIRVLQALHEAGRLSRSALVSQTGLSRATVASLVTDLLAEGLVQEDEPESDVATRTGRPPQTLTIVASTAYAVGVDIGHAHVRAMLCDATGMPVWQQHLVQPVDLAPESSLDVVTGLIERALADRSVDREQLVGIGISIASPVYRDREVVGGIGIMPGWVGKRPAAVLADRLEVPARLFNDANAGAYAERQYGAGRTSENMIYIRLGEGIGAGIVSGGNLLTGSRGLAGEVGHLQVSPDGLMCRCGNRGCLETVATPSAIARSVAEHWDPSARTGSLQDLIAENRTARYAVEDAGEAVGRTLSTMVTLLNPDLIVIGGSLARAGEVLFDSIRRAITRHAMPPAGSEITVVAGELLDDAEVRGAAAIMLMDVPQILLERAGRSMNRYQRHPAGPESRSAG